MGAEILSGSAGGWLMCHCTDRLSKRLSAAASQPMISRALPALARRCCSSARSGEDRQAARRRGRNDLLVEQPHRGRLRFDDMTHRPALRSAASAVRTARATSPA
jgi:hypothetical protein